MEAFERHWIADVKEMAGVALGYERAVLNFPGFLVLFSHFPTVETFSVAKVLETGLLVGRHRRRRADSYRCGQHEQKCGFHSGDIKRVAGSRKSKELRS